jgi:hypothetical protein
MPSDTGRDSMPNNPRQLLGQSKGILRSAVDTVRPSNISASRLQRIGGACTEATGLLLAAMANMLPQCTLLSKHKLGGRADSASCALADQSDGVGVNGQIG